MLRPIEVEALITVNRGDMISEIATKPDHSERYADRSVFVWIVLSQRQTRSLSEEGCLEVVKYGLYIIRGFRHGYCRVDLPDGLVELTKLAAQLLDKF